MWPMLDDADKVKHTKIWQTNIKQNQLPYLQKLIFDQFLVSTSREACKLHCNSQISIDSFLNKLYT